MIHLQQFNAYLKISWIKRFFSNLKGGWQKIMAKNIKYYGGERIFSLQKEKILEISKIFKISYECITFDFFWFPIPYKIKK
jgi:hypothetical protein